MTAETHRLTIPKLVPTLGKTHTSSTHPAASRSTVTELTSTSQNTSDLRQAGLRRVASNLRWSWHRPAWDLLSSLPGAEPEKHPVWAVDRLEAGDPAVEQWFDANGAELAEQLAEVERLEQRATHPDVAYFCPEFGIAAQVPQYSGGLGILAGDHLKAASDLSLPLVGIGLFYRRGFFRQEIVDAAQAERYEDVDPIGVGAADTGVLVPVSVKGERVMIRVWELWVGATRMLLLDSDVEENSPEARRITDRLYAGDRRHRLSQELVLGVAGVRALRALGLGADVYHLNEGHACFLLLELLAEHVDNGEGLAQARTKVRDSTLFTTHTPVPAGIDRFDRELVAPELDEWAERLDVTVGDILDWATLPSDGPDKPFNTAAISFAFCGRVNGVSQLHASVSRRLFGSLPQAAAVEGITNGVHARTWVGHSFQDLYDRRLGAGWENGDEAAWANASAIEMDEFNAIRDDARTKLVDLIYGVTGTQFDPNKCVLGFARRFATYKRANLLLKDPEGLKASIDAGAQFVFAGKAHPADNEGKALLAELARYAETTANSQIVIIPDYDIEIARVMYAGCDVWLNNPIRPREACGTSGEKAALNGVLNCSISDGWWADWYTDGIGWVIPTTDDVEDEERDRLEAAALHGILTDDVLRLFNGSKEGWFSMVQTMLTHLGPLVTAGRMVDEYNRRFYQPIRES